MERNNHIVPRVLADDLCLWIRDIAQDAELLTGDRRYVRDMCRAIMATLASLTSMGARVARDKGLLLASEGNDRRWLRKQRWGSEQIPIPVANCARDLGAFVNMTAVRRGGTLNVRFDAACHDAARIGRLPRTVVAKDRMLGGKAMPKACYGVQTTQPRITDVRRLQSRNADAVLGRHQSQRCPEIASALADKGKCEVRTDMLMRRWHLLRRVWHARPAWQHQITRILGHYFRQSGNGENGSQARAATR